MPKIALAVEIPINPEHRDVFAVQLQDHAAKTLAEEEGCLQFDAHTAPNDPNLFFIYEVYADKDAMATHRASPQLARYREATAHMVIERRLSEWFVLET